MVDTAPSKVPIGAAQRMADERPTRFAGIDAGSHPLQMFDAGTGAGWHIHYGSHVKYDSNDATRVDFTGRNRRQIGYRWEQVIQNNGLAGTKANADFIACKTWIRNNIA